MVDQDVPLPDRLEDVAAAGQPRGHDRMMGRVPERRQLEVAMTLATSPRVLLFDEPLAGMGSEESARMVELLRKLVPQHATLLVEHDMDAVFALADTLTVMVNGRVLASGPPEAIRANREVQQAYLGADDDG